MNEIAAIGIFAVFFLPLVISLKHVQQSSGELGLKEGAPVTLGSGRTGEATTEQTDEIIGWRAWKFDTVKSELWLKSVVAPVYWKPGEALQARYFPPAVGAAHGPGIYAAKTEAGALEALEDWSGAVYGTVALWGTVVEHVRGYRAEYAYPRHLWCKDKETARELSRRYGCESEVGECLRSVPSA